MKLLKIFQLEFTYQLRQWSTWIYALVIFAIAFLTMTENYSYDARDGYFMLNAPIVIAEVTVICCLFWLLIGAAVAGQAAARDVSTRMYSLTYTAPTSRAEYLGGRFLAVIALSLLILLAIPFGILCAVYLTPIEPELLVPFRLAAYLQPLLLLVLPNVLCATGIQFALASLKRSVMASYLAGGLLFLLAFLISTVVSESLDLPLLGKLIDPIYLGSMMDRLRQWSPLERNSRLIGLDAMFLANRVLWLVITLALAALCYFRFRFTLATDSKPAKPLSIGAEPAIGSLQMDWGRSLALLPGKGNFNWTTPLQQLKRMTIDSFLVVAKKASGLPLLALIALVAGLAMPGNLKEKGVPLLAQTDQILHILTAPVTSPGKFIILIFLLTIFYAGELLGRDRQNGINELIGAAPVSAWVLFCSRFLSLALLILSAMVFLCMAGLGAQAVLGSSPIQWEPYLEVLLGFQLIECLLFGLFVLALQVLINQKYLGHLVALAAFGLLIFAPMLGVQDKLLVFSSSPPWSYTAMGGFGSSVAPWLWLKAYWSAWAVLLAFLATLLWVRGSEHSFYARLKLIPGRLNRTTLLGLTFTLCLIAGLGSFIFYNTHVRNPYQSEAKLAAERAAYELRYGKYRNAVQPVLTRVDLRAEIYHQRGAFELKGRYTLVNNRSVAVDTLYVGVSEQGETNLSGFSRRVSPVIADRELSFLSYALKKPLAPGDTLAFEFSVSHQRKGFTNNGADSVVSENFASFRNYEWMPVIGYQSYRELDERGPRKKYGLSPRAVKASLYDLGARSYAPFAEQVIYHTVIGTDAHRIAVAPGTLLQKWNKGGRSYFQFVTQGPIRNEYAIVSADFALHQELWRGRAGAHPVYLEIYYPRGEGGNVARMAASMKASLDYYTRNYGSYSHHQLRFLAMPGLGGGNHASPTTITAGEGFFALNPAADERGFDLVSAVVAHEVAHQWWGNGLKSADVQGAGLLSESLAWYSAMGVLQEKYGQGALEKLLAFMREAYEAPRSKAALPLLQAMDFYHHYRKGPFALYALSEYLGRKKVDGALARLVLKHPPGQKPMATSLDLYQELNAVTPDSLRYLLGDLFARNTFWQLKANNATLKQLNGKSWQVNLEVKARKMVVSEGGVEKEIPVKDWIQIGVYAPAAPGEVRGKCLYLKRHLVRTGRQLLTFMVRAKPDRAGIDPNFLLIDWDTADNLVEVDIVAKGKGT